MALSSRSFVAMVCMGCNSPVTQYLPGDRIHLGWCSSRETCSKTADKFIRDSERPGDHIAPGTHVVVEEEDRMPSLGGSISSLRSPGEHLGAGVLPAPLSKLAKCCERGSGEPTLAEFLHLCSFLRFLSWPQSSTGRLLLFYCCVSASFLTDGLVYIFPG